MEQSTNWYDTLPAIYRAELEALQHGLSYFKFLKLIPHLQTGGIIQIQGELTFGGGKIQLIQVLFPYSYPYSPPEVYPLENVLDLMQNPPRALIKPKFFYRGNQYTTGKICLFRDEEAWVPFYHSVHMALEQAQKWFETATSEMGFTENLIVEENNPLVNNAGQLLYFLEEIIEGTKGALLCKVMKENFYLLHQIQVDSATGSALINTFPKDAVSSFSKKDNIYGQWYRVKDAKPKDLLPKLSTPEGLNQFLQVGLKVNLESLLTDPDKIAKKIILGFIIGEAPELHCFQIFYWKEGIQTKFQSSYLLPKNITKELFVRIDALFKLEVLSNKKVMIIGLGAIGSEVSKELAASSIGNFVLVDEETFEAGNAVRHAADLQYIGEKKVDIAKKIIHGRNPNASVQAVPANILQIPNNLLSDLIDDADVIVDLTANPLVESYLHDLVCKEKKKTLIQAAASKGGLTGIVLIISPGNSMCLDCLKIQKLNHVPTSALSIENLKETAPDYGACSKPALPASGIDTREIAIQTSRTILQFLLKEESIFYPKLLGYQLYWNGPAGAISQTDGTVLKPFDWRITNVEPTHNCKTCN